MHSLSADQPADGAIGQYSNAFVKNRNVFFTFFMPCAPQHKLPWAAQFLLSTTDALPSLFESRTAVASGSHFAAKISSGFANQRGANAIALI